MTRMPGRPRCATSSSIAVQRDAADQSGRPRVVDHALHPLDEPRQLGAPPLRSQRSRTALGRAPASGCPSSVTTWLVGQERRLVALVALGAVCGAVPEPHDVEGLEPVPGDAPPRGGARPTERGARHRRRAPTASARCSDGLERPHESQDTVRHRASTAGRRPAAGSGRGLKPSARAWHGHEACVASQRELASALSSIIMDRDGGARGVTAIGRRRAGSATAIRRTRVRSLSASDEVRTQVARASLEPGSEVAC